MPKGIERGGAGGGYAYQYQPGLIRAPTIPYGGGGGVTYKMAMNGANVYPTQQDVMKPPPHSQQQTATIKEL